MEWENLKTYRERLLWAMKEAKLTSQSELARRVGVKPQSIQHLLDPNKNAQGSSHTARIAEELNVSANWLATGEGSPLVIVVDESHRLYRTLKDELTKGAADIDTTVVALTDVEKALIRAYREIVLPEQREEATAPLFAKAEEARRVREHYERLTGRSADGDKPDHELEHLRAPAHIPPAPRGTWNGQERRMHAEAVDVERRGRTILQDGAPAAPAPRPRKQK
jgi:transcriptional regulator with XRE-family HTH domain